MADHIYPPTVPQKLLSVLSDDMDVIIAADSHPRYISIEEATKIRTSNDLVRNIGKNLVEFDCVDAGLFIMRNSILEIAEELVSFKEVIGVSDIINHAIHKGLKVRIADIRGTPWLDVDTPEDINKLLNGSASELLNMLLEKYYNLINRDLHR